MKVGYLGPEGTFSEEAGKAYAKKLKGKVEMIPYTTIHDLLFATDRGHVAEAMVPIENSVEGTIGVVTDMLVKDVDLKIKQEIVLPVYHYLLAQKGVKLSDITDIISNPPPIDQCREFLRKKLPKARMHLSYSTAEAARQVASSLGERILAHGKIKGPVFAAIGTAASAQLYGLQIVASKINARENSTRFVVLAKGDAKRSGADKTSIVFSILKNKPGGLHDILKEFADRNINLTKIESRPSKKSLGDYYFFLDCEGHHRDRKLAEVLAAVKRRSSFYKLLGSYPRVKY
ncbi:prephenate dehydratase [Candidatus Saganbacteria bacterium]|nr:prephenate dehydratase [Candidatus Saganbacteria bacterium]